MAPQGSINPCHTLTTCKDPSLRVNNPDSGFAGMVAWRNLWKLGVEGSPYFVRISKPLAGCEACGTSIRGHKCKVACEGRASANSSGNSRPHNDRQETRCAIFCAAGSDPGISDLQEHDKMEDSEYCEVQPHTLLELCEGRMSLNTPAALWRQPEEGVRAENGARRGTCSTTSGADFLKCDCVGIPQACSQTMCIP